MRRNIIGNTYPYGKQKIGKTQIITTANTNAIKVGQKLKGVTS